MKKLVFLVCLSMIIVGEGFANNLILGTPTINGSTIQFTIQWDNSWRVTTGPANWDAVWVFVKRQTCVTGTENPWEHADLSSSGHTITGSQLEIELPSDRKGVFIKRNSSSTGVGNISQAILTLTLSSAVGSDNIGVYGIEMVAVPEGQFYIGDGDTNLGENAWNFSDGNSTNPKLITSAIQSSGLGTVSNYQKNNVGGAGSLGSNFPLGYNSFYCMKYEITSAQFVAFMNSLTYTQQLRIVRDANTMPPESAQGTLIHNTVEGYRIEVKTPGAGLSSKTPAVYANDATDDNNFDQPNDGLGLPIGLGKKQFLSYLDWAALRPMTEFEYEKACRGPVYPVPNEYSWGTRDDTRFGNYSVTNRFTKDEVLSGSGLGMSDVDRHVNYRVGIAATATSNRLQAGATYYGILGMTGGMYETVVGRINTDFTAFTNANGDGNLTSDAFSNVVGWNETILGARGASWHTWVGMQVSGRGYMNSDLHGGTYNEAYWAMFGGRGVRTF